jgi:hypothetical protein
MTADSDGIRRTRTERVKGRLRCQLQRSAFESDCDPPYMNQGVTGGVSCVVSFVQLPVVFDSRVTTPMPKTPRECYIVS